MKDFDPNVLWQCFSSCFSARLSQCPVWEALPSKIKSFFQKAVDRYTFLPLRQIHQSNRENKIVHCCLPDCPVVGARQGRRPALLFITSSLSLHLQSSRLLAANTLCHFDKYVLPF